MKGNKRKFPTKLIRQMCDRVYGRQISDEAWSNWKAWAGCPGRRMWLDCDQALSLLAISRVRARIRFGEISRSQIQKAEIEMSPKLSKLIAGIDGKGLILGRDIETYLTDFFLTKRPSESTLRRKIPGFSRKTVYPKELILKLAS